MMSAAATAEAGWMTRMLVAGMVALSALCVPASAFELAQDLTCEQAIAYYEKNRVIYVLTHNVIAVPIRVGVPVKDAGKLQCPDQGQMPHGYSVKTKDRWRCIIAVTC
jgi:hypothetical protein